MLEIPDKVKPYNHEAYCLRFQEYLSEKQNAGEITDAQRVALVYPMLPTLNAARSDSENGNFSAPGYPIRKDDWDGKDLKIPPGLNIENKGGVLQHARRVHKLNAGHPDIDKLEDVVAEAKMAALASKHFDDDIEGMING